jgi:osmotically-inducible protein OsmY
MLGGESIRRALRAPEASVDMSNNEVEKKVRAAFERETRINMHRDDVEIEFDGESVTLSGEVEDIAAKRLALELAAALPEVSGVVDRLRVRPSESMGDGAIAARIEHNLLEDSSFGGFAVRTLIGRENQAPKAEPALASRNPPDPKARTSGEEKDLPAAWIEIHVQDGVVTLDGDVPSLSHKRLAGAIAWWEPGSRDVINGLGVEPSEADSDEEVLDALRIVLEKDPLVDATQVHASCRNGVVTLEGYVQNEAHRDLVEFDAWAVFGVDRVVNRIQVP